MPDHAERPPADAILLTIPQTAALLQLSEWTVYKHIASGELEAIDGSAGRRSVTRVPRPAIDKFIAKRLARRTRPKGWTDPSDTPEPIG